MKTPLSYRWVILLLCWFIYFSFGLVNATLSAVVSPIVTDLNLSYSQMGFILGTWQMVYVVVAIPLGFLIDRIGTYRSLLLAVAIVSASAILRSFAHSFEAMVVFVGLFGIGGSMVSIGIPKVVSMWFTGKERATAAGIFSTGGVMGSITALSLTNSVVIPLAGSWRSAYIIYGLFGLLITAAWLLRGRSPPDVYQKAVENTPAEKTGWQEIKQTFTGSVLLVILIGVTGFLVGHGIQQWLPSILAFNGMGIVEAGFAVSMVNVFMILGTLLASRLPLILGSKKRAICLLLFVQGLSVLTIAGVSGPVLWTILALRGLSSGIYPILSMALMDLPEVGPRRMGRVGGVFFSIGEIGGFAGPAVMGLLKDSTGTFLWGLLFLFLVCEAMIIPALFLKIDRKDKNAQGN